MKTVHLIFKTHLDVGFTDLAANVFRTYCEKYIPQALKLAREMRESGRPERFVWTVGSWLIYEYLEQAGRRERRRMEEGIAAGDIAWHALPFTTHTELMDSSLFRFGISLSKDLDRRFGRRTIAGKMTDVPGHCRAIVPLLAQAGVRFLHVGVNPACKPPRVPPVFRWRAPDGSEVVVAYSSGYGSQFHVDGLDDGLAFAHTGDNQGPPPAEGIRKSFDECCAAHPGARVIASTLDAFARRLLVHRGALPVVTDEIGDTWIHGSATDPRKIAEYRALCRLRNDWERNGLAERYAPAFRACSRHLLLVPEHTWGLDEKTHLGDYRNYTAKALARARRRDRVSPSAVPEVCRAYAVFKGDASFPQRYSTFERSWDEQREYVRSAVRALAGTPLAADARRALRAVRATAPKLRGFVPLRDAGPIVAGEFKVQLDRQTGAIVFLQPPGEKASLCTARSPVGLFRYQTLAQVDFDRRLSEYAIDLDKHGGWAIPDLAKPGMDAVRPRPRHAFYRPTAAALYIRRSPAVDTVLAVLKLPDGGCQDVGAPREVVLQYLFRRGEPGFNIDIFWTGKAATRLPEAIWFSFQPRLQRSQDWRIEKMGEWFSPLEVVENGNRNLHAVGRRICKGGFSVETLDAPLVAPGQPRLLEFDNAQPELAGGMHFNLYNNVWGTNFPMWSEADAHFRFVVRSLS